MIKLNSIDVNMDALDLFRLKFMIYEGLVKVAKIYDYPEVMLPDFDMDLFLCEIPSGELFLNILEQLDVYCKN